MSIQESGEMYIETIYVLTRTSDKVRSIDVCDRMGYSKPSVSRAIGILKRDGYINVDASGYITLTDSGIAAAERIYERHTIITQFLVNLGVSAETAATDACKMEHTISDESFAAIKKALSKSS
ncbi:MAG: metal-dependent transcriptional regulator [Clostridia bacterium]|nr:metal-dependent transcriptional regulator [Clostridia bacterium]